jgi:hypothetical protein
MLRTEGCIREGERERDVYYAFYKWDCLILALQMIVNEGCIQTPPRNVRGEGEMMTVGKKVKMGVHETWERTGAVSWLLKRVTI